MLHSEWESELARNGLSPVEPRIPVVEGAVPCPACGNAAPLVDGACSDCGLVLA